MRRRLVVSLLAVPLVVMLGCGSGKQARPEPSLRGETSGTADGMAAQAAYLDVAMNVAGLEEQVGRWVQGADDAKAIAEDGVGRIRTVLRGYPWPPELMQSAIRMNASFGALDEALEAEAPSNARSALPTVVDAHHDLTHDFYDKWLQSMPGMDDYISVYAGYHDFSMNIAETRVQLGRWEKGEKQGLIGAKEEAQRLETILRHTSWPEVLAEGVAAADGSLSQLATELSAGNLVGSQAAMDELAESSDDISQDFYGTWLQSQKETAGPAIYVAYLDLTASISDLKAQLGSWERGNPDGLRLARETAEQIGSILGQGSWAMYSDLTSIREAIEAGDVRGSDFALAALEDESQGLTREFDGVWLASLASSRP